MVTERVCRCNCLAWRLSHTVVCYLVQVAVAFKRLHLRVRKRLALVVIIIKNQLSFLDVTELLVGLRVRLGSLHNFQLRSWMLLERATWLLKRQKVAFWRLAAAAFHFKFEFINDELYTNHRPR